MDSTHDEKLSAVLKIYRSFNGKSVRVFVKNNNNNNKTKKKQSQQSQPKNTGENVRYSYK